MLADKHVFIRARTSRPLPETLRTWRQRLLNGLLLAMVIIGAPTLVLGIMGVLSSPVHSSQTMIVLSEIYVLAYLCLCGAAFVRRLPYHLRALVPLAIAYVLAITSFWYFGTTSDGGTWMFGFLVLATVLFNTRTGLTALAAAVLALVLVAWGRLLMVPTDTLLDWVVEGLVVLLLGTAAIISMAYLIENLDSSMIAAQRERSFVTTILDTSGALVVVCDPNGQIMRFNASCERASGYQADNVRGRPLGDLFLTEADREKLSAVFQQVRAGRAVEEYEMAWHTRQGEPRLITWSTTALRDDHGNVDYIISSGIDITERKQAEMERTRLQLEQSISQARLNHELAIARRIQESLLPRSSLQQGTLEVAATSIPASEVGGDFYAIYPLTERSLVVAVGDTSGKGIGAAVLMGVANTMLTTLIESVEQPSVLLARLNELLRAYTGRSHQNVALCAVRMDAVGEAHYTLLGAGAGAMPPILRRVDGTIEWLPIEGLPLGTPLPGATYQDVQTSFYPGDILVLCSDGLLEARDANGAMLSFEGIEHALRRAPQQADAQTLLRHLQAATHMHTLEYEADDDVTLLVIRVAAPTQATP